MTKTDYPTGNGVSRTLKAAGHKRNESTATRVRGYRNDSGGYVVKGGQSGKVYVMHTFPNSDRDYATQRQRERMQVQAYADTLKAEGYNVIDVNDTLVVIGFGNL